MLEEGDLIWPGILPGTCHAGTRWLTHSNAFIEYVPMPGTASGKEEDTDGLVSYGAL